MTPIRTHSTGDPEIDQTIDLLRTMLVGGMKVFEAADELGTTIQEVYQLVAKRLPGLLASIQEQRNAAMAHDYLHTKMPISAILAKYGVKSVKTLYEALDSQDPPIPRRNQPDPTRDARILEMYQAGETVLDICAKVPCAINTVYAVLRKHPGQVIKRREPYRQWERDAPQALLPPTPIGPQSNPEGAPEP